MPTYIDEQAGVGRHISEVYKDDVYRVTHCEEEFQRLIHNHGWSPTKEPGKTYRPVHDTQEAHEQAWYQADAELSLKMDRLRATIEDQNQEDKARREARVTLGALQKRRDVIDEAKVRIFGAPKAPEVVVAADSKDKSVRKVG